MLETLAKLKLLYEIGQYVVKEKPDREKLLKYLQFLKDGYENKLVNETDKFYVKLLSRKGVKKE